MNYFFTLIVFSLLVAGQSASAALSATVSLSPSTTTINHPVSVNIAISNTGASQLTVNNVKLTATSTQNPTSSRLAMAFSTFNQNASITIGPNATTTIPGGNAIFFSPSTGVTGSGSGTYSVGATIYTSDGSVTAASAAGVATINPIPLPAYERQ